MTAVSSTWDMDKWSPPSLSINDVINDTFVHLQKMKTIFRHNFNAIHLQTEKMAMHFSVPQLGSYVVQQGYL